MKQFNVRDGTHKLGRELSLRTGKSILDVVQEALEVYEKKLVGPEEERGILLRAVTVIDERMCEAVHEGVLSTIDEVLRLQEELREQQAKEMEQLLAETSTGEDGDRDDLEEVPYEEIYGSDVPP